MPEDQAAPVLSEKFNPEAITKINEHLLVSFPNLKGCNTVKSDIPEAAGCVAYYCIGEEDWLLVLVFIRP